MIFKTLAVVLFASFSLPCFATLSLSEMTLEEKVGQLLMVHFNGEKANKDAEILIQKVHVGGIIYYNWANGLDSPKQVLILSTDLQKLNAQNRHPIPLLIAADQEGGIVARLTNGFTVFPGNKALGMTEEPELAELSARAIGQELSAVGINFNLSPVVDVNNNPRNPVIGIRSFGDSPCVVTSFAKSALQGYHKEGIITSLKHFPGHGDVEIDSHQDLPVIKKTLQQLQNIELLPFSELALQADTIMTAHIMLPLIDPINCATLSKDILDILRKEIGFEGVIISDSLVMEGLLKNCASVEDGAVRALNAGCDILMLGGRQLDGKNENLELTVTDIERIHQNLVHAVNKGIISEQRLNEAVQRILDLKNKYDLSIRYNKDHLDHFVNTPEHQLLSKKIASCALKITKNKSTPLACLQQSSVAVFAPLIMKDHIEHTSLLNLGRKTAILFFNGLSPTEEEIHKANLMAEKSDILIFFSYNAWKNSSQIALFQALSSSNRKKSLVAISLRDPLDSNFFSQADLILTTFSPTFPSIQAACERLYENSL